MCDNNLRFYIHNNILGRNAARPEYRNLSFFDGNIISKIRFMDI